MGVNKPECRQAIGILTSINKLDNSLNAQQ